MPDGIGITRDELIRTDPIPESAREMEGFKRAMLGLATRLAGNPSGSVLKIGAAGLAIYLAFLLIRRHFR